MDTQTFLDNFATIAEAPGGIAKLRTLILDLAVRGDLVEQRSGEEAIGTALAAKRSESGPTVKAKVPGRPKVPRVPEQWEERHAAPPGWEWARIDDTGAYVNGLAFNQHTWTSEGTPIIRIQNLTNPTADFNHAKGPFPDDRMVDVGDILVSWSATLEAFVWDRGPAVVNQHIFKVIPDHRIVDRTFLFHLLRSSIRTLAEGEAAHGLVMKHINRGPFVSHPVAIPPLAEQQRIVAKVDELMALCDKLEAAQQQHERTSTLARSSALHALATAETDSDRTAARTRIFDRWESLADSPESVADLRQLVRKLAVEGDLTSRPNQAPAGPPARPLEVLRLDKLKLWRAAPRRSDLPPGWQTYPLAQLGRWGSGGTPTRNRPEFFGSEIPWAVIGDLNDERLLSTSEGITPQGLESSSASLIPADSVLIAMYGASIGKLSITGVECATNQAIAHCIPDPLLVSSEYLFLILRSVREALVDKGKGAAQPNISQTVLKHLLVDLPTTAEQVEIVSRVNEMMPMCDEIEAAKSDAQDAAARLAASLGPGTHTG
jgi:type I restriction enzyme S subunit